MTKQDFLDMTHTDQAAYIVQLGDLSDQAMQYTYDVDHYDVIDYLHETDQLDNNLAYWIRYLDCDPGFADDIAIRFSLDPEFWGV